MARDAEYALHAGASLVVFVGSLVFEFLVRKAVAENTKLPAHRNPQCSFLHIDKRFVILVATSLKCSDMPLGRKACSVSSVASPLFLRV